MVLSPAYYTAFATTLAKEYSKTLGIQTLSLTGLGSQLSGNYRKTKRFLNQELLKNKLNHLIFYMKMASINWRLKLRITML